MGFPEDLALGIECVKEVKEVKEETDLTITIIPKKAQEKIIKIFLWHQKIKNILTTTVTFIILIIIFILFLFCFPLIPVIDVPIKEREIRKLEKRIEVLEEQFKKGNLTVAEIIMGENNNEN